MDFIEANTRAVFRSKHFAELSHETLAYVLQSDRLQADEAEVLRAVKEWGTVNSVVGPTSLAEVLRPVIEHVRFPMLDKATLKKVEDENEREQIIPVRGLVGLVGVGEEPARRAGTEEGCVGRKRERRGYIKGNER